MGYYIDDGIPVVRHRRKSGGLVAFAAIILVSLTAISVAIVYGALWFSTARVPEIVSNPSHSLNFAELLGYLNGHECRCAGYGVSEGIFGLPPKMRIALQGADRESDYIDVFKTNTDREAHDFAGRHNNSLEWGLFVFVPHGDCRSLMESVRAAIR